MIALSLTDLLSVTAGTGANAATGVTFTSISTDTRTLEPGALFVALGGENFDGHDFVARAAEGGARGALVSRRNDQLPSGFVQIQVVDPRRALGQLAAWHRRRFYPEVVAITGSVGKTTTKEMCALVLQSTRTVLIARASYNNEIGLPLTLLELMPSHQAVVLELAMRGPGQIAYLAELAQPTIGVVTTIGDSHLELLGSREAIADAKAELLQALPADGHAVLNRDDDYFARLAARARCPVISYGFHDQAEVRATGVQREGGGTRGRVQHGREACELRLPVPGLHNVSNALAALAVGSVLGQSLEEGTRALAGFTAPPHRLRMVESPRRVTVIDDCYNASPASVAAALQVVADTPRRGRRIFVFGDMKELGPRSEGAHREVGAAALMAGIDWLITVGDLAQRAAREAQSLAPDAVATTFCDTAAEALEALRDGLRAGDLVLVKASRAMKLEEVVDGLLAD